MTTLEKETIITHKSQLIEYFQKGNTAFEDWGIGTEHEKFLYRLGDFKRLPYNSEVGIKTILQHFMKEGWSPIMEKEFLIGVKQNGASITLEPGGQFELSGKNFKTIHHTFVETRKHFDEAELHLSRSGLLHLTDGRRSIVECG